jgi:hypothetical protein
MTDPRPHQVVVKIDRSRFHSRLREIEGWLAEWQIDAEIGSVLGVEGHLRLRFADDRAAYAFQRCHGGWLVSADEIARAQANDTAADDLYERLAREYPD